MVVRIAGERMYLWRAVDHEGEVLDVLVQGRRDSRAALRLMRKLLRKQGFAPKLLVTDKLRGANVEPRPGKDAGRGVDERRQAGSDGCAGPHEADAAAAILVADDLTHQYRAGGPFTTEAEPMQAAQDEQLRETVQEGEDRADLSGDE